MPRNVALVAALAASLLLSAAHAANLTDGMQQGTPDLKSAGPLTFAPASILLVGDPQSASVFAIATGDTAAGSPSQPRTASTSPKGTPVCTMPNGPGFMPTNTTRFGAAPKRPAYAAWTSHAYSSGR